AASAAIAMLAMSAPAAAQAQATVPVKIYAQELVDRTVAQHPDLRAVVMHVTPPKGAGNVVIASSIGRIGKPGDADDLKVLDSPNPTTGVYSNGKRFGVDLALRDRAGAAIGTMNVGYPYREGEDTRPLLAQAVALRDEMQARIAAAPKLDELDP